MRKILAACCFVLLAGIAVAHAGPFPALNQDVGVCDPNAPSHCIAPDASGNVPVTGTITASLGGFTPSASGARMTPLTVTTADSSGSLPTGTVTVVSNVGANPMYCNVNGVAATTSDELIPINSWFAFTIPNGITTLHCIATGGSTTANGVGGAGLATGAGGGSSGGGGGGTVAQGSAGTNAGAWWMQIGDTTNGPAAVATAGADAVSNTQSGLAGYARNEVYNGTTWDRLRSGTATGSALVNNPTAANLNATVVGTGTFSVQNTAATPAGTNVIGKVGIDQTTPGTTNGVVVNSSALPTGAATAAGLTTINTTLGTPFQAGGSIGNTTFAVTQATAASLNATVVPSSLTAWGIVAQGSTTSGQSGQLMMGAVTTGAPTYTTAQTSPLSLDTAGNLRVNVVTGGGSGGTSSTFGSAFPSTGTAIGLTNGTNMVAWSATTNYGTAPSAIAVPAVNAFITNTNANGAAAATSSSPTVLPILNHASTTALGTSLVAKASAGNLNSFNCTAITGGAAGYCIAYNGTTAPATGALTGANVLDFCYFDTTARGCSLSHLNGSIAFSTGIVILATSAASPYTYTTGTDTAAIEADIN